MSEGPVSGIGDGALRDGRRQLRGAENAARWDAYSFDALGAEHPLAYFDTRWSWERPILARIAKRLGSNGRLLEVGCGLGAIALWFAAHGHDVVGVDFRDPLVERARALAESVSLPCRFEVADAFELSDYRGFDVAISFGMIEHWPRSETVEALRQQARAARQVVAVVPTPNTRFTGAVTDERFYSRRALRGVFTDAGLREVYTFSYGEVPTRSARAADWLLPARAATALRAYNLRFAMAHAVFGVST
jgi:2-polyprenyl-3-methyl-5-hydroxy-6-metoxy-1,4-benzoquinol methylase